MAGEDRNPQPRGSRELPVRVTYHEACHLVHGQKISQQPRELLRAIPGVELVELPEAMLCCGSAGIYNITQPEMSLALLERKMKHIAATGARDRGHGKSRLHRSDSLRRETIWGERRSRAPGHVAGARLQVVKIGCSEHPTSH